MRGADVSECGGAAIDKRGVCSNLVTMTAGSRLKASGHNV